ncbi:hypothetical protein FAVG1_08540 [Fusarium avenaceum]|nr:hypothetical protein FAVG1_08540 [Fusarium avenaceum]
MSFRRIARVAKDTAHQNSIKGVNMDEDYPQYQSRAPSTPDSYDYDMVPPPSSWIGHDSHWVNTTIKWGSDAPSASVSNNRDVSASMAALSTTDDPSSETETCIFAKLAIPGRGEPVANAAIGISSDGTITFFGSQKDMPNRFASIRRVDVGYILPGLWDCHAHFSGLFVADFPEIVGTHPATSGALAPRSMYETLMAGFTSVRDVGSFALELAPAVDIGWLMGPNIFGAGAAIGITGGSCDACTLPADWVYSRAGTGSRGDLPFPGVAHLVIADGVEQCRLAVRQQIRRGATCIKIVASGGVLSRSDDVHCRQYSDAELDVMMEEAHLQGRSVAVHAHGKAAIMAAIRAGATTIEHGSYLDDEAARYMAAEGVALVPTRTVIEANLTDLDSLTPETRRKMVDIADRHKEAYATAIRHNVKIALGTDIVGVDPQSASRHGRNGHEVVFAVEAGLTPLQAIEAGTINGAETLGKQMPKKGLIKVGWDADLIALDENPLEDIRLFADPDNIMNVWKGGLHVKSREGQLLWPISAPKKIFC